MGWNGWLPTTRGLIPGYTNNETMYGIAGAGVLLSTACLVCVRVCVCVCVCLCVCVCVCVSRVKYIYLYIYIRLHSFL